MPATSFSDLFVYLRDLMTNYSHVFLALGTNLLKGLATILVVWFGIKSALSQSFRFDKFVELILSITFTLAMLRFYNVPLPGIGYSFYQLFTVMGDQLAKSLDLTMTDRVAAQINATLAGMQQSTITPFNLSIDALRLFVISLVLIAAEGLAYIVVAFGYVAAAIGILLGPIFIPFFLVPRLDWIFWGWFKYLLQYSFYPVVAQAMVFVMGNLLLGFFARQPPPYDGTRMAALIMPFLIYSFAFIFGVLKIPSLVNSLFTGRSGDSALPRRIGG